MLLYNHLTGLQNKIDSADGSLSSYFCGPTVHAVSHVGHARTFSVFDSMRKFLTDKGIVMNYGMNITDIDDKINVKVRILHYSNILGTEAVGKNDTEKIAYLEQLMLQELEKKTIDESDMTPSLELYYKFVDERSTKFWEEMKSINVDKPTVTLRVSQVMTEIEEMIQSLIDKGMAYESNGSVYFNTVYYDQKFCKCQLSNSSEEDMNLKDGHSSEKINIHDFALWKKAKQYYISFPSRWGNGTPGWSIECSVMSSMMFGNDIKLHGGGIDLKFPHHHNEVLQSNAHFDKSDVFKHFVYVGHICVRGEKMAQSVGNYLTIENYLSTHSSNSMRLLFWMTSWSKPMDLTDEIVEQAVSLEKRIDEFISTIKYNLKLDKNITKLNDNDIISTIYTDFRSIYELLEDDFKSHETIHVLNEIMTKTYKLIKVDEIDNTILKNILKKTTDLLQIIGFVVKSTESDSNSDEMFINEFIELRKTLKQNKQYQMSDYVRDVMFPRMGYVMQDLPTGIKVSKTHK